MPSSPDAAPAPRSDSETRILGGWLNEPLAGRWCMLGWGVATGLFVALATLTGGPGRIDAAESVYSTWAIAHGRLSCVFPSVTMPHEPLVAPVYPVVSGFVAALAGIGHTVPFPPQAAMGPHCETAVAAVHRWALEAGALEPTLWVAFTGWLVLAGGVVAWLRASGRGRCRWEPATVIVVACLPPVWICISFYFHPQDLFAMGFALAAMACAATGPVGRRGRPHRGRPSSPSSSPSWLPRRSWCWLRVGAAGGSSGPPRAAALVVLPLVVASSGHALRVVTLGSGDNPSIGGTALWELSHRGPAVVVGSRVLPVVLALGLSWWVTRRVGPAALSAPAMVSLAAASLSLRLIFEQNLLPYYFMALVVALLLVDVAGDRCPRLTRCLALGSVDGVLPRRVLPPGRIGHRHREDPSTARPRGGLVALCPRVGLVPPVVDLESHPLVGCRGVRRPHLARARTTPSSFRSRSGSGKGSSHSAGSCWRSFRCSPCRGVDRCSAACLGANVGQAPTVASSIGAPGGGG